MFSATFPLFLFLLPFTFGGKDRPVFSEDLIEILLHVRHACMKKSGVAEVDITNCELGIFKDDRKLKCYMKCLLDETMVTDHNERVDYDMLIEMLPKKYRQRAMAAVQKCLHEDTMETEGCQRAFNVQKCWYGMDPDFYFIT